MNKQLENQLRMRQTSDPVPNVCVIRLTTSVWQDANSIQIRRKLSFMRRLSSGFQILDEDSSCAGVDTVVARIKNLHQCSDGLYRVKTCDERTDWETGTVDDYNYMLIPYETDN